MTLSSADSHSRPLILLSNREPYEHVRTPEGVELRAPAGGLVTALDPILRRLAGTWVAWASGSADAETADACGRLSVPQDDPSYTMRRVWLSEADIEGYYLGFANSALWPLCHLFIPHLDIRAEHWARYMSVNQLFASAVAEEAERVGGQPMVWVQDYHFALAPRYIREKVPQALVHQFWHIPFPPSDVLRLMPLGVHEALLRGLLGNDLIEFQTPGNARNFMECVERGLPDAEVDWDNATVHAGGHSVRVQAFPISIDVEEWERLASLPAAIESGKLLRSRYAADDRQIVVSVDRIDYTKGLVRRLRAIEQIWTEHPERRGQFTVLFIATPSRSDLVPYADLEAEVVSLVASLNARFGTHDWHPIVLVHDNVDADTLAGVYRAADICLVSSIQDGMNLVAKEYVACQLDVNGVLVLSRFAGAADEFDEALLVNPFFVDAFADTICVALDMPAEERTARMLSLRAGLHRATIHDWLESILAAAEACDRTVVESARAS